MIKVDRLSRRILMLVVLSILASCIKLERPIKNKAIKFMHDEVIERAEWAIKQLPVTITDFVCDRSAGSINEFYSEGDYWWPHPEDPDAPYIRRDGETNPNNFVAHRHAMIRLSKIVGYLTSAYILTEDEKYANHALAHLYAWFINPTTMMKPHLLYAQAIKGRVTGRGIGIIDTIHLMEVAQSVIHLMNAPAADKSQLQLVVNWFESYLEWITTHPYGEAERDAKNNHGTCWVMQAASFAKLTQNEKILDYLRDRYKTVLLPNQMSSNGSFPLETVRTKPFGYSLFNLDAMATICQILSIENDNLWNYETEDGLGISLAINFITPYVKAKEKWIFQHDVMCWDEWPVAHPFMIFYAIEKNDKEQFELWKNFEMYPNKEEVIRNLPIRNPILWL